MPSSLKARHAARYATLGRLLVQNRNPDSATATDAEHLVAELEKLGPTFIKLGQLLSTRADLLPPVYLDALSKLRDDVKPLPAGEVRRIVEEELGARVSKAFGSFNGRPVGAASLGQVHRATLRDGRPVAVKVQRPGVRAEAAADMEVIAELADFVEEHSDHASRMGFAAMVERFRRSLMDELDYRQEAANLRLLGEKLSGYEEIVVPQPVDDYTTSRVLTMDFVEGRSVGSLPPVARTELDCRQLGEALVGAYLDLVLVHGFFHADPHPGNVLLTNDGRLALVDVGMVARLSPEFQDHLLRLLLAMSSQDGAAAADALEHLGTRLEDFDREELRARIADLISRHADSTIGEMQAGEVLGQLAMASSECGSRPRPELTLLAKTLLNLDQVARILAPDIQVEKVIEAHAARVMRHRMVETVSPAHVMRSALDAAAFAEALPGRLNKVLESLAEGKLTLSLEGLDEAAVLRGAQKLANRVATGVLIAAFVVAAALFSGAQTTNTLWGYPVLTMVFLFLALIVTAWLAFGILRGDLPERGKGS